MYTVIFTQKCNYVLSISPFLFANIAWSGALPLSGYFGFQFPRMVHHIFGSNACWVSGFSPYLLEKIFNRNIFNPIPNTPF